MIASRHRRAQMLRCLQHSVFQALFLGGTLLGAVGCSDDSGPDGIVRTSSGGASAGAQSDATGAAGSHGSGGATAIASGGATQASTPSASAGSTASGGSTSSTGGDSTQSGGTTATGGKQASGGTSGGQGSGGSTSSAQSSGGQSTGGSTSSAQSSGGQSTGGRTSSAKSSGGQSSGGASASSAKSSGGQSSGGTSSAKSSGGSTGGTSASSSSTSTGNPNTIGPNKTCGCLTSSGNYSGNPLTASIVVDAGETYDGGCKTFTTKSLASGGLGDGSQEEDQKPLFRVNGGKLMNVILGAPAADGVHFHGNATAENIHWLDIGEDASTIKAEATVNLDCGSAKNGSDKVFQVNAKATWNISNFTIKSAGKTMRENGDKCYPVNAVFDHCDISDMKEVIFRTDCTSSKVTIKNTRYSGLGDGLVMIGETIHNSSSGNVTITNVQKY